MKILLITLMIATGLGSWYSFNLYKKYSHKSLTTSCYLGYLLAARKYNIEIKEANEFESVCDKILENL